MNRYETTISITASVSAPDEKKARRVFEKAVERLQAGLGLPSLQAVFVEMSEDIDCMEVGAMSERFSK